jgi:hypothetical protein
MRLFLQAFCHKIWSIGAGPCVSDVGSVSEKTRPSAFGVIPVVMVIMAIIAMMVMVMIMHSPLHIVARTEVG